MKRIFALALALAMLLTLPACKAGDAGPSSSEGASPSDSASPSPTASEPVEADLTQPIYTFCSGLPEDGTAVTVNGTAVTNGMYFYYLVANCYQLATYYAQFGASPDFSVQEVADALKEQTKNYVTYYAVLREVCAQHGAALSPEDAKALETILADTAAEEGLTPEQLLQSCGLTEAELRYTFETSYLFDALQAAVAGREPTQAELEEYVADQGIFSCKHILLKTVTEDQKDEAGNVTQTKDAYNAERKALAEDLLSQIQAEGDNAEALLDSLAEQYSEDGRKEDGTLAAPEGYTFDSTSSLVDGFREGTLALQVGETGLVETSYGYHVILRLPVDTSAYQEDWPAWYTSNLVTAQAEQADAQVSPEIESLDLADFYQRCVTYTTALYDQFFPEEAQPSQSADPSQSPEASPAPSESD